MRRPQGDGYRGRSFFCSRFAVRSVRAAWLTARRRRNDHDFLGGQREHPVTVGGDADEFGASAATGELRHLRGLTCNHFFVVGWLGARNWFFIGFWFGLFRALFPNLRRK